MGGRGLCSTAYDVVCCRLKAQENTVVGFGGRMFGVWRIRGERGE